MLNFNARKLIETYRCELYVSYRNERLKIKKKEKEKDKN